MDSDVVIGQVLQNNFELTESGLSKEQLTEKLIGIIRALPDKDTKVISIVGGAASGKSDLSNYLATALYEQAIPTDSIGTDDFNKGDRKWRREHFEGENPPDPTEKYAFELMNGIIHDIKHLGEGEIVPVPVYDEKSGLAVDAKIWPHQVKKVDVLLVQGDFHPTESPDMMIYLHLPDAQRLENRKRRDTGHREKDEQAVVDIFHYRQGNQHFPHTLPNAEKAGMIIVADAANPDQWKYNIYERKDGSTQR